MRRRNRHRLAKAEFPCLGKTGGPGLALALVGEKNDAGAGAPDLVGEELVRRRHAGAGVDDHHGEVGTLDGTFGLASHPVLETAGRGLLEPGGVDHPEAELGKAGVTLAAVARHPGLVVDNGVLAPDQPVEQR